MAYYKQKKQKLEKELHGKNNLKERPQKKLPYKDLPKQTKIDIATTKLAKKSIKKT